MNRRAQRHSTHKTEKHKRSTKEAPPWNANLYHTRVYTVKKGPDQTAKTPKQLDYWVRASRVNLKVDQSMLPWHIQQVVLDDQALKQYQVIQSATVDSLTSDPLPLIFL